MLVQINDSIKKAMSQGDREYVNVLRLVKAELLNNEKTTTPKPELEVVKSYVKKLSKALDAFVNRPDQLARLTKEIEIINEFLPKPVSAEQILDHVQVTVQNLITAGVALNPGAVSKSVKLQLPEADGGLVFKLANDYIKGIAND
ncbi:MAG: GatB/YqeY domain-containing protein [Lachnospiraceae bacterium]|nr:GatB/YqeY domain-containing protein [Lachnospiraceae bacterium]